jgi:hypothetical protein
MPGIVKQSRISVLASLAFVTLAAGCGGGGSGTSAPATPTSKDTTPGVYKGTITSTTTGQTSPVLAMVGSAGQAAWMSADGRVWSGTMPATGAHFDVSMMGRMYPGATFPDGSTNATWTMNVDHVAGQMSGRYSGAGHMGNFSLMLESMASRPASLTTLAGVYTRSTWSGYAMTMTIGSGGDLIANDSRGCMINGMVTVPDSTRNLYSITATVSSCGVLDGTYHGEGSLQDADAMRDWMAAMHPLEQGGYSHGNMDMSGMGHMGGGMGGMTYNTVPSGTSNLFMFVLDDGHHGIMDALAR